MDTAYGENAAREGSAQTPVNLRIIPTSHFRCKTWAAILFLQAASALCVRSIEIVAGCCLLAAVSIVTGPQPADLIGRELGRAHFGCDFKGIASGSEK